jgi:hypothetical protein
MVSLRPPSDDVGGENVGSILSKNGVSGKPRAVQFLAPESPRSFGGVAVGLILHNK